MSSALSNGLGIAASYVYVFAFIGAATLLMRRGILTAAATRKVIHIGVAHWWLIAMALITDPWVASIGPASFIIINAVTLRFRLLPAMDEAAASRNLGTVYFPVALLVLVNLCWRGLVPIWVGGIAVLVLGWGDGLAALFGEQRDGAHPRMRRVRVWGAEKSWRGTAAMFAASFAVALAFTLAYNQRFGAPLPALGVSASVAAAAAAVELLTPLGIDNLTVPLVVTLFYAGVFV
jgi:phytol kinase